MDYASNTQVLTKNNVRQWRDFLDVLLFARQNRCELVVPSQFPDLDTLLEIKSNITKSIEKINYDYTRVYQNLRAYRGRFDNLSSLLVLQNMKLSSGRVYHKPAGQKTLLYTSANAVNHELEAKADFIALAIHQESQYVGTKVFMKKNMIELVSL